MTIVLTLEQKALKSSYLNPEFMKENKIAWFFIGTGLVLVVLLLIAIISANLKDFQVAKGIDDDVKHPNEWLFS